jgi:hypothetical protein
MSRQLPNRRKSISRYKWPYTRILAEALAREPPWSEQFVHVARVSAKYLERFGEEARKRGVIRKSGPPPFFFMHVPSPDWPFRPDRTVTRFFDPEHGYLYIELDEKLKGECFVIDSHEMFFPGCQPS